MIYRKTKHRNLNTNPPPKKSRGIVDWFTVTPQINNPNKYMVDLNTTNKSAFSKRFNDFKAEITKSSTEILTKTSTDVNQTMIASTQVSISGDENNVTLGNDQSLSQNQSIHIENSFMEKLKESVVSDFIDALAFATTKTDNIQSTTESDMTKQNSFLSTLVSSIAVPVQKKNQDTSLASSSSVTNSYDTEIQNNMKKELVKQITHECDFIINTNQLANFTDNTNISGNDNNYSNVNKQSYDLSTLILLKNNFFAQIISKIESSNVVEFSQNIKKEVEHVSREQNNIRVYEEQFSSVIDSVGAGFSNIIRSFTLFPIAIGCASLLLLFLIFSWPSQSQPHPPPPPPPVIIPIPEQPLSEEPPDFNILN